MNSFDPLAINPVSGTPGVVTFAGVDGTPERAFATDCEQLRAARRLRLSAVSGPGARCCAAAAGSSTGPTVSNTIGDTAALGFSTAASFVVSQATTQSAFRLRDGFPAYARQPLDAWFRRGAGREHGRIPRFRSSIRTRWRRRRISPT